MSFRNLPSTVTRVPLRDGSDIKGSDASFTTRFQIPLSELLNPV